MAGKQSKLRAYTTATDLAVHLLHVLSAAELELEVVEQLAMASAIGMMTDLEIGSNTKYRRKKSGSFVRAAYKLSKINSCVKLLAEVGTIDKDEQKVLFGEVESLGKMIWGLVKSINTVRTGRSSKQNKEEKPTTLKENQQKESKE